MQIFIRISLFLQEYIINRISDMNNLPKIGKYNFVAEPFHCDFTKHLFIGHLGNNLLNAADFHSNDRGYGVNYLNSVNKTWVLSRLSVELDKIPAIYEDFVVETWIDSVMRYFTNRNFKITNKDGYVYGYGKSIWAMIDTTTRQPVDILKTSNETISEYLETDYANPIKKSSRVKLDDDLKLQQSILTTYSDIDINGHVNSIKYIEHILDLFPIEYYKKYRIKKFDIAYIMESHNNDKLNFYTNIDSINECNNTVSVRVTKSGFKEEKEVCRCQFSFG
ncbi:MAG: acyl-[acyl-carrier-protein] thioesterase [Prevotella pallens]|nr:acyl-[acyl-carrier-protein] thioesterase [Prevotella pallens]MBF1457940.1 acyl-[acyl-carrier-protein] thioesterase [Prevotella pallens]MBF1464432.1 acyl-[acyl-carrier-protein] thioesterase [Prevotella pallens]MBF1468299.1 acyl-[acyl-carrier-protein] thioesterase [Prevotella pallens]MBF1471929.1 acyl-[acyl-carrier-protein] thioesterase [Prevotella pallens]